jgi:hypothetical protein
MQKHTKEHMQKEKEHVVEIEMQDFAEGTTVVVPDIAKILPEEMILETFKSLSMMDIATFASTCKFFELLVMKNFEPFHKFCYVANPKSFFGKQSRIDIKFPLLCKNLQNLLKIIKDFQNRDNCDTGVLLKKDNDILRKAIEAINGLDGKFKTFKPFSENINLLRHNYDLKEVQACCEALRAHVESVRNELTKFRQTNSDIKIICKYLTKILRHIKDVAAASRSINAGGSDMVSYGCR